MAVVAPTAGCVDGRVRLLGVRHHGPGSARSVVRALDADPPAVVCVELPADTEPLLRWIADDEFAPPVAMLAVAADDPARVAFWPLAEFSPEYQAIRWAIERGVPVRAIDVPANWVVNGVVDDPDDVVERPIDPLAALAAAAGEPDAERWWDDVVEHRGDGQRAFAAVAAAMGELRRDHQPGHGEALREAHQRRVVREALDLAGFDGTVAVVGGAWHVPALDGLDDEGDVARAAADERLLRAVKAPRGKRAAAVTWVPWSDRRLRSSSGYGAGVAHPGWYRHVFAHPGRDGVARFFVDAAATMRRRGLPASPDHLIAATRLADTLATLRQRPRAGLGEVLDAMHAVMATGDSATAPVLGGVLDELTAGTAIGAVPPAAPQAPLVRDVAAAQRAARLRPTEERRTIELDLRTPNGHRRSVLLHRLHALGVDWGTVVESRRGKGTFRETWQLDWDPAMAVRLVERSSLGTTLHDAATAALGERVAAADRLGVVATAIDEALLADLPAAVEIGAAALGPLAARSPDAAELIDALPPLTNALRYGDVRATAADALGTVVDEVIVRVIAALDVLCRGLDDDAAAAMVERLSVLHGALAVLEHPQRERLPAVLIALVGDPSVHGAVRGRAMRLLHDAAAWSPAEVSACLGRALGRGTAPADAARFVDGFVAGAGTILLHDRTLLTVIDQWVSSLRSASFDDALVALRRTFGAFETAERRQLAAAIRRGDDPRTAPVELVAELDGERVAAALTTVRHLLGLPHPDVPVRESGHPRPETRTETVAEVPTAPAVVAPGERVSAGERSRRWRLILGGDTGDDDPVALAGADERIDAVLGAVYDIGTPRAHGRGQARRGGLSRSAPAVARWLGELRQYFPTPIVQIVQRDAIERLDLTRLLLEPELIDTLEPDVHLLGVLLELNRTLGEETKAAARGIVARIVADLEQQFGDRLRQAVNGALRRAARTRRPRPADIDWRRTIEANLKHWIPERRTVVPEQLVGFARRGPALERDVIVAVDQSGSMSDSVVHASLFACVLARMPALRTSLVAFDTSLVDLSDRLDDPVDTIFGVQLGGGTDIGAAVGYCRRLVERPHRTLLLLVTDLHEGGDREPLRRHVAALVASGVTVAILLALSDSTDGGGGPVADEHEAATLAELGAIVARCTPSDFPDLLASLL